MSEKNNFIYQNKLDSVSALCSKKMALEILRNAFKKWYNYWVSTFLKTLLWIAKCCYGNCLWRVSYKRDRCSQEAAVNLHIGIKKYFLEYLSHFVKKEPKWWLISTLILHQIIFPVCFRAVQLYKPVCWSDCVVVGFDQDGEYLLNSQSSLRRRMRRAQKFNSIFNLLYLSTFKLHYTWL